jgi:hypothetical protein
LACVCTVSVVYAPTALRWRGAVGRRGGPSGRPAGRGRDDCSHRPRYGSGGRGRSGPSRELPRGSGGVLSRSRDRPGGTSLGRRNQGVDNLSDLGRAGAHFVFAPRGEVDRVVASRR